MRQGKLVPLEEPYRDAEADDNPAREDSDIRGHGVQRGASYHDLPQGVVEVGQREGPDEGFDEGRHAGDLEERAG